MKVLDYVTVAICVFWHLIGIVSLVTADTCSQTAPALFYNTTLTAITCTAMLAAFLSLNVPALMVGLAVETGLFEDKTCPEPPDPSEVLVSREILSMEDGRLPRDCTICLEEVEP